MDITVRKANVLLTVPEEQRDEYLAKGYDVLGANGGVVVAATPNDVPTLQAKLQEALDENAKLKKQIAELQSKANTTQVPDDKPKRTTRTKKTL